LYTTGTMKFESLIELVNYYERHPLYKKIKLSLPVNEETVRLRGLVSKNLYIFTKKIIATLAKINFYVKISLV